MADKSSSELIPKGWEFETKKKKDGSLVSHYICYKTGQRFYTYEDMMRYVNYAKEAGLPIYLPNFDFRRKKTNASQSSEESAPNDGKSWNLDSGKDTDIEKSLDSDVGESMIPKIDLVQKISDSVADTMPSEAGFKVEQKTRQANSEQAPAVEVPSPRIKASVTPKSSRCMKRLQPQPHPSPSLPGRARMM